jgi:hypothetical protein
VKGHGERRAFFIFGGCVSYRNKTYVIFDGDNDMWAYTYLKGWKSNENMKFDFYDAHDLQPLTDRATDETIKSRLRARFANAKQVVVLVGEQTKNLRKWVPWEIEIAQKLNMPIIVVNLNGIRKMDADRCPVGLRVCLAAHVAYKARIIQHALDNFPDEHSRLQASASGPRYYNDDVYKGLGL